MFGLQLFLDHIHPQEHKGQDESVDGSCGYHNRTTFRNAIYFHLGGLDLYPEALKSAHPKA